MESHHAGLKKHFLKLALSHENVERRVSYLLNGNAPHYPLHLTLSTIHLDAKDFSLVARAIESWKPALPDTLELAVDERRLELMGKSHVKFLSLCFSCVNVDFEQLVENLSLHLTRELGAEKSVEDVNGRREYKLSNASFSLFIPLGEKKIHVSLLSSNDLKKYNKPLAKIYAKDNNSLLTVIDELTLYDSNFVVRTISFT